MPKEFIMRGKTSSGKTEVLSMGTPARAGYGYILSVFDIYPSLNIGDVEHELSGSVTAANTSEDPSNPNFNHDGLIATAYSVLRSDAYAGSRNSVVNDTFVITQDLILAVMDVAGSPQPINWQVRFKEVKLSASAEAVANFKQYTIYNTSS